MLDVTDRKLVGLLQQDGRLTNAELAEQVGLSQSACHRRVKRLEDTGVISGYGAFVDRKRVGLNVLGYVSVKMESHSEDLLDKFTRGVEAIDEIVACYAISGGGDYLLKVVAADMDAYADVALKKLMRLPGVKDSTTNFVLSTVKLDPAWPI
ncbi:MAG: Lrp/AsnC family transcriptional regulator [Pseudomonadota bacterium]